MNGLDSLRPNSYTKFLKANLKKKSFLRQEILNMHFYNKMLQEIF